MKKFQKDISAPELTSLLSSNMDNWTFFDALRAEGVRGDAANFESFCAGVSAFTLLHEFTGFRGDILSAIGGTG